MKTVVVSNKGELQVWDIDKPRITSKQALVKTVSCGICGTDATIINQSFKGFEKTSYPLMLGHEGVGEVVEIGSEVKGFSVGDLIVLSFVPNHMHDNSPLGSAWGAFSEYGIVDDFEAYEPNEVPDVAYAQKKLPDFIDKYEAPVLVTLREVFSSIKYFNIQPGDSIVVYGSGPVAMTFIKLLSLLNVQDIVAVVRNENKKQLLESFGLKAVINSSVHNVKEQISVLYPEGMNFVLDAVGSENIINEAITLLKDRGEVLCYGVPKVNNMNLNWANSPYNWKLNFQQMPYKEEEGACHDQIVQWICDGKLILSDFISEVIEFEHIIETLQDFVDGKKTKKVIIKYK
ncbi:alcohol dehydrogenase catalytic domain-containing protein [Sporosarcina sp. FSL K6-6792]|uniref:zinc-dependent alcohol dehydrogenase n=1 Tax=Sporosarcina sp. FSL K6-6792 TaxID=2921559 RepID=UPI0030FA778C